MGSAWGEVRFASDTTHTDRSYTGQRSYTADFGLMFYNARWYDSSVGRFTQADTVVPRGIQGLDRYAYANNSPLNYIDPTGHFTEDAIMKYLLDYYKGDLESANAKLEAWKNDADWWDMITTAQAGDTLFGTMTGPGGTWTFRVQFTGEGQDVLTGIVDPNGKPTSIALEHIQAGRYNTEKASYNGVNVPGTPFYHRGKPLINWCGLVRFTNGTPSFYIRPKYRDSVQSRQVDVWQSWITTGGPSLVVGGIAFAATLGAASPALVVGGGVAGGWAVGLFGGIVYADIVDMEAGDWRLTVGDAYLNLQYDLYNDRWNIEQ